MDWSKLTPSQFEELCFKLISKSEFKNVSHFGGTGDRARDIVAEHEYGVAGVTERNNYLIQCKRKLSGALGIADIRDVKDWLDSHGDFDRALIIAATNVSSDTQDWLAGINKNSKYKMRIWEKAELELQLSKHPDLMKEYFPDTQITNVVSAVSTDTAFSSTATSPVPYLKTEFETKGGEVIVAGGMAAATSISGTSVTFMGRIDGKEMNPQSFALPSITHPVDVAWRNDSLPPGKHIFEVLCKTEAGTVEIDKSRIKIIEIPKEKSGC